MGRGSGIADHVSLEVSEAAYYWGMLLAPRECAEVRTAAAACALFEKSLPTLRIALWENEK